MKKLILTLLLGGFIMTGVSAKSTFQAMTLLWSAIQSGGIMRRKLFTPLWKASTGMAKNSLLYVPAVEAVLVAAEVTLQNLLKVRTLKAEKILSEEVAQMLRNILKDC